MTLNLFRLNSPKCRYCQDGIAIPLRLLEEKSTETESEKFESSKENKSLQINDEDRKIIMKENVPINFEVTE